MQSFMGIYQGQRPEFVDKKLPAQGVGREVTHTKSEGVVKERRNHRFDPIRL
jgi:hypothetical protein